MSNTRTTDYEIAATFPMQVGKGKIEKPKENGQEVFDSGKARNNKYGFIEIKEIKNGPKEIAALKAKMKREGQKSGQDITH